MSNLLRKSVAFRHLRKRYTGLRKDGRDYEAQLKVDHQTFALSHPTSRKTAEWYRDQLTFALLRLVEQQASVANPPAIELPLEARYLSAKLFRSTDRNVPAKYRIDPEFNCLGNAENLAEQNPRLTYVEGLAREKKGKWGAHAWCETHTGKIVDPYFEWMFGTKRPIEYKHTKNSPFDQP